VAVNLRASERLFGFVGEWIEWEKGGNIMEMMGYVGQIPKTLVELGCYQLKASEGTQWSW